MSPHEPRIAILVLGCLQTVYERCINTIRSTWGAQSVANVDIYYVYGGQSISVGRDMIDIEKLIGRSRPQLREGEVWVSGDVILCGAADVREDQPDCILRKRLYAFGHLANERQYDFIYTVCAASYVDAASLKRYAKELPPTGIYHGALHVDAESRYPFVSGASFLISQDIAANLARNAKAILSTHPETMPDDVVIGHFIATQYCRESVAEIAERIANGIPPTDNQTFVAPFGQGSTDFVCIPEYRQVPRRSSYHFHFNSTRLWEMENFHRRFFAASAA